MHSLRAVKGWQSFVDDTSEFYPKNYLWDAARFCHKVYAMLDAFESGHRYVVWIDADTQFIKKTTDRFFKKALNGKMCAYLGRKGCYSETGCIIFDTKHEDFAEFKRRFRSMYDDRKIFFCDLWVDCVAFDESIVGLEAENLTPDAEGMVNVFERSILKDYIAHNKGQGFDKYKEAAA